MERAAIKIPSELFALAESSRFDGRIELSSLPVGPDDWRFDAPLDWRVEVTNTGSALLVTGLASGRGVARCSRCLAEVAHDFEGLIEGFFLIGSASAGDFGDDEEDAPGQDEFDVLGEDHVIDLAPLITAALMVDTPNMPLCSQECLGLCPRCGADLNEGPCGCALDEGLAAFEDASNPFAVLKSLKFDGAQGAGR